MAKLSAHGREIGRVEYLTSTRAWFADGKILINRGSGWKLYAKVKDGIAPETSFQSSRDRAATALEARPMFAAYRKALHKLTGVSKRWKVHTTISLMPDDADGVWSMLCDDYGDRVHADFDEINNLCTLYKAAIAETQASKVNIS